MPAQFRKETAIPVDHCIPIDHDIPVDHGRFMNSTPGGRVPRNILSSALLALCALALVLDAPVAAQTPDDPPANPATAVNPTAVSATAIREVRFEGLATTTESYALSVVRTTPGAPFDPARLDEDVSRLLATGKFATVTYRTDAGTDGVAVTFVVRERPRITSIEFDGNVKFSDKKLRAKVPLQVGDPLDTFRVREGADAIKLMYRDAGYGRAEVGFDADAVNTTGALVYSVEEGPRIRIRQVNYVGNSGIETSELTKKVKSKTYIWIFRDGKFDEDTVEADAAAIQNFYRDEGYLDARVSYQLDFSVDQQDLTITFTVVEGRRYAIESIDFRGNTVFTRERLLELDGLEVGEPVRQTELDSGAKAIREALGADGYIYTRVEPIRVFSETPDFVRITFDITEGEQYTVGRIVVRGNERTKDKVIRRELDLYPEDIFNLTKAREAELSLRQTQLFGEATVTPVGDQPGVRDVLINVEQSRSAGNFIFGFGVTSNSGLVGSIVLDLKNFDLFDTPKSFAEFIKLRSFHGAGQRLRIEAQPGTELTRFRIDFTEPYLMDKPLRFDASLYYFERGRRAYNERRIGGNVSFGKRLKKGPLKDWYGEFALRLETVRIDDLDVLAGRDIHDAEGDTLLTSAKVSLVRDRTDNRFAPSRGDKIQVSYEQFGLLGGELFGKVSGGYSRHYTVHTDELERKSVLSFKGVTGYVVGDAPVFERYYAGGIGSVRGFEFRGISPRQGVKDDPIGGDFMLLFSTEYSYPLYGELLRGLVFTDMGTVEPELQVRNWRVAIGTGVRLQVDFFGPVPLEFDVAVPVIRDEEDEDQIFSFFIGATF
jgi:outer membrane protein insertion porin family